MAHTRMVGSVQRGVVAALALASTLVAARFASAQEAEAAASAPAPASKPSSNDALRKAEIENDLARPPSPERDGTSKAAMLDWFEGEHQESTAFQVVGVGSLVGGAMLMSKDGDAADAAGVTFLAFGGLITLFSVSYALPLGTTRDRIAADFDRDPELTRQKEIQRARGIADRFVMYRWGEIAIAATGVGLVAGGAIADEGIPIGIGAGLATEGALALFLDSFGERRVATYIQRLEAGGPPAPRPISAAPPIGLAITPQGFSAGYRAEF